MNYSLNLLVILLKKRLPPEERICRYYLFGVMLNMISAML